MDKNKIKQFFERLKPKLAFLKPWESEDEEVGEDLNIQEVKLTGDKEKKKETPEEKLKRQGIAAGAALLFVLFVTGFFFYYNSHHLFTDYVVTATAENLDIDGTQYAPLGSSIIKYSTDGVFCVNTKNEAKWSAAYSMQTPITAICGKTMVIAEQQGTMVYVLNDQGVLGNFETDLPILKAKVSSQGVVALLLNDDEVTWIELYDASGTEIAKIKTTLSKSGYPLDMALNSKASKMLVSYLDTSGARIESKIAFYDFSSADESDESHMTGTLDYADQIFPEVFYADDNTPVAVNDSGFITYKNGGTPTELETVQFETEIVSCFHDENYIGFVFPNDAADCRYQMEVYRYSGKRAVKKDFDCDYTEVKMDGGEILLYDAQNCTVYSSSGVQRFSTDYEKPVKYFMEIAGFRKYLVITNDSMDSIRIS